ncbi:MAG TPA: zinc-ribbon domain containing protein, partial [Niastella sp.]
MTVCLAILEEMEKKEYKHYKELNIDTYNNFIDSSFEWACDVCLQNKKAILASPAQQNTSLTPSLAYHDIEKNCRTCGAEFTFTKEEKKLWYEQLKFWIDSEPVNCLKCRRQIRLLKAENKTLSDILQKDEQEITIDELKIVSDIYRKWDKIEKVKFYESMV